MGRNERRIDDPKDREDHRLDASPHGDASLRSRAEQRVQALESQEASAEWPAEARQALHELRVHQIELDIQNEQLRATQEQLEASRMRYFDLYDRAPVGYLTLSEAGLIQEANLTAAIALGVDRKTLRGRRLSGFVLSDDQNLYYRHFHSLFKSGQPQNCELRFRRQDNAPFWARLESTVAAGEDGAPVWRAILVDITERKRAEERLHAVNEQLVRANEDLSQFAFAAGHDLQTPLQAIANFTQLLINCRGQLGQEATLYVQFIAESAEQMRALLGDLLVYTQLTQKEQRESIALVDLNAIFRKTLGNFKTAIEESGAAVTSGPLPTVSGYEPHFVQLFQNLIGNSLKYRADRPPRIHVSAAEQNGAWRLAVADNGIGIDPEYHRQIFGAFKRLHSGRIPGTGLGLAICKRIVERYGGRIWVDSEADRGATFNFILPLAKERRSIGRERTNR